jgi:low temperature requirement protein LtrA
MSGRDPQQKHRAATTLELLFDLAFVVAFAQAADQLTHAIAEDHLVAGVVAFAFVMFAVCWAWINFSWFASAYDTDDWFYRVTTMVQMIGVVVLALGIPALFTSLLEGDHLDNAIIVAGYVIMRIAMVAQWARVAVQDPPSRRTALTYVVVVIIAQLGWVIVAVLPLSISQVFVIAPVLYAIELGGPIVAERTTAGTPWHPHHIAERYGLLVIIALGEVLLGTVASISALVTAQGWSAETVLVAVAGVGLTFGLWWTYFIMPSGPLLERHRARGFVWGYAHIVIFAAIAAVGAGLHVAALVIENHAAVGIVGAVAAIAVPIAIFAVTLALLYTHLMREGDSFHVLLFILMIAVLGLAVVLAVNGASLGVCLIVLTLAPAVVVIGFETIGHRHQAAALERALR